MKMIIVVRQSKSPKSGSFVMTSSNSAPKKPVDRPPCLCFVAWHKSTKRDMTNRCNNKTLFNFSAGSLLYRCVCAVCSGYFTSKIDGFSGFYR